jgi:hypothetical protein
MWCSSGTVEDGGRYVSLKPWYPPKQPFRTPEAEYLNVRHIVQTLVGLLLQCTRITQHETSNYQLGNKKQMLYPHTWIKNPVLKAFTTGKKGGTRWRNWLSHCAISREVTVSNPDGVTGIFQCLNPSGRIVALGWTQPLTEMSTRNPSWG